MSDVTGEVTMSTIAQTVTNNMYARLNSCDGIYKDSLDVRFTKACDNRCEFCIERKGITGKPQNVPKMIEATKLSGKTDILILGGEPMLNPTALLEYVTGIKPFVKNIYITTSLPIAIQQDYATFEQIMDNITCLNVSLQHYDWKINNEVLHATSKFNRIKLLEKICTKYADKVRVSINLVRGYIDTRKKLDEFLTTMEKIGVKHTKINELQHEPDLYVAFKDLYNLKLPVPYVYGCQGDIELPYNMRITLKRACFCVQPQHIVATKEEAKKFLQHTRPDLGYTVLYEDGSLSKGWITED